MSHKPLSFAIFGSVYSQYKCDFIKQLFSHLEQRNAQVFVDKPYLEFIVQHFGVSLSWVNTFEGNDFTADFVISVGGDGTLLQTATRVIEKQIPIIGINAGRLGFLTDALPCNIEITLESIYKGDFKIEKHAAIEVKTIGEQLKTCHYALNDVALLKRDNASMIGIDTFVDEKHLVTYQADGLVVSTPTGSTAYNLSNGGPVVVPNTAVFCLTPVAPHSLGVRPIIISDLSVVRLKAYSRSHNFLLAVDGRSKALKESTEVVISKAPHMVNILRIARKNYFEVLKEKMNWGEDKRE